MNSNLYDPLKDCHPEVADIAIFNLKLWMNKDQDRGAHQRRSYRHQDREELEGEEASKEEADGELGHLPHRPVKVVATERANRV
jgi:hypothetical protein